MSEESNPWKTQSSNIVYSNPWVDVHHDEIINPSGNEGIYGRVHFKNIAVGVIPLDDAYNTWIVGQYRYTLKNYSWEIPEGGCPMGTDPIESAKRELLEETGITATEWLKIMDLHTSNSVTDEIAHLYLATNLKFGVAQPEETELLRIKKIPFDELYTITMNGEITDAMSVSAILKTKLLIDSGKI